MWSLLTAWAGPEITPARAERVEVTFTARGTDVTQIQRDRLESAISRTHGFFEHGLGVRYPEVVPMHVTIYADHDDFASVRAARGVPAWAGGWFASRGGVSEAHIWTHDDPHEMTRVFLHESVHWLLRYAGRTPRWLDEGLAQCFAQSTIRGNLLTVQPPPRFLEVLAHEPPSVRGVVLSPSEWLELPEAEVGPLYVQGWALTAFLLSSKPGQDVLAEVLRAHARNPTRQAALDALETSWKGGVDGLQRDLDRWLAGSPSSVPIPRHVEVEVRSDAMWTSCGDGRLVATSIGCGP